MELHESLYALGLRLGREVFDDPDSFRGALDDFLDEDAASTGDINLLVDAVRLGAFSQMASMLDSGAQPAAAVEEAGQRLARDRGSADVSGAQWACAVLGFAIGKVPEGEVRRHRTQHSGGSPLPPQPETAYPGGFPASPAGPAPTQYPGPPVGSAPTMTGAAGTQGPSSGGVPSPSAAPTGFVGASSGPGGPSAPLSGGAGGWQPPQKQKRKTWPIVVGVAAVVALIAGGGIAIAVTGDDDNGGGGGGGGEKKDEPAVALDLDSVNERYAGLAEDVTSGAEECTAGEPGEGVEEVLECAFANGTIVLTTYSSAGDLNSGRNQVVNTDPATRVSKTDDGVIFSVDSSSAVAVADESTLYWDSNEALQSAQYVVSSSSVTVDLLTEQYDAAGGVLTYPTAPEDPGMTELAKEFIDITKCSRIQTIQAGEVEESYCDAPGDISIFMGVFQKPRDFKNYRRDQLKQAADQGSTLRTWNFGGGTREGALAEFVNSSGAAVRYWDRQDCLCYMEASLANGDQTELANWWTSA